MSEDKTVDSYLGATARWTASARARESERADFLFNDPWAATLAGPEGAEWIAQRSGLVSAMVIRTRYFDDFLQQAVQRDGIRQIVLMAAGLDTRAYRLGWPEQTRIFELDQPAVLAYKEHVLQSVDARPACALERIAADLTTATWQDVLIDRGFAPLRPAAWLLEGFLFYIPGGTITQLLTEISELTAKGSWLGFDIINSVTLTSPITRAWIDMQAREGAPWVGSLDDPEGFLEPQGWKVSMTQPGSPDANFGRWTLPVIPVKAPGLPHNWYITAHKE